MKKMNKVRERYYDGFMKLKAAFFHCAALWSQAAFLYERCVAEEFPDSISDGILDTIGVNEKRARLLHAEICKFHNVNNRTLIPYQNIPRLLIP